MPDTTPVATVTASPRIEYRQFLVHDEGAGRSGGEIQPDRMSHPEAHGVLFTTGGNDFYPHVQLEVWPGPPPEDSAAWETTETVDFDSPSARIRVREWDYGPSHTPVDLGAPGTYRLRASCRGRAEAAALVGHDLYYEGIEEWLLQVWPAAVQGDG